MSASSPRMSAQDLLGDFMPKMVEVTDSVLYGDIWERPELSKRDRSLITVASMVARGITDQLPGHLHRAVENGVTETELKEVILHMGFYAGWQRGLSAIVIAKQFFSEQPV